MLFKQWNEIAEPRHQLDFPSIFKENGSLESSPLPQIKIEFQDTSKYTKVILTTGALAALFPASLLGAQTFGKLTTELILDQEISPEHMLHSWDFDENFPNEIDPEESKVANKKVFSFSSPIVAFEDTLLISLQENFLKVSPIFINQIAKELFMSLMTEEANLSVIILGTSDQISELKPISDNSCSLCPPEFVTGFVGSILSQLVMRSIPFEGFIAPSEGPVGFEKLTLETMENLVEVCSQWVPGSILGYSDEVYRRWRLDGSASGAQSGLYI